jgi:alpha-N-arabinofuranosidase
MMFSLATRFAPLGMFALVIVQPTHAQTDAASGPMSPEAYVERMKIFSNFIHNDNPAQIGASTADILEKLSTGKFDPLLLEVGPNGMRRIAVGPDGSRTAYTEAVMKAWSTSEPLFGGFEGLSLHSYTLGGGFPLSYPATDFGEKEYAKLLRETLQMEQTIATHSAIMDKYDPQKKVALVVDEWGAWLKPMPGTNPLFLKQQNSLRDAILASLNLNIFARHADRVRMANIAQMVNVIQSMILTDGPKMLLTPTYYIYKMYLPFQDAKLIPVNFEPGQYSLGEIAMSRIDMIAARSRDGKIWLALTNIDPNRPVDVRLTIEGEAAMSASGEVLTAERVDSINSFGQPRTVLPQSYSVNATGGGLVLHLRPKSVTVVHP